MAGYFIYSLDWNLFRNLVERPTPAQLRTLATMVRAGLDEPDEELDEGDPMLQWPDDPDALAGIVAQRLALPDWYGDLSNGGKSLWERVIFDACMPEEGNDLGIDVGFRVDSDGVYWDVIERAWKLLKVVPNTASDVALASFGVCPFRFHPPLGPPKTREEFDREQKGQRSSIDALGKMLGDFLVDAKSGTKSPEELLRDLEANKQVTQEHKDLIKDALTDDSDDDVDDLGGGEWSAMHSMHVPDDVRKMHAELVSIESKMVKSKDAEVRREYEEELMPALAAIADEGRMLFIQVDT